MHEPNYFYLVSHIMTIVLHVISIGLYMHVAIKVARRRTIERNLQKAMIIACMFAVLLSTLFSGLQAEWVLKGREEQVGYDVSYAWLLWEYLLVFYMIAMGQVLNVISLWSRSNGPRRTYAPRLPSNVPSRRNRPVNV